MDSTRTNILGMAVLIVGGVPIFSVGIGSCPLAIAPSPEEAEWIQDRLNPRLN